MSNLLYKAYLVQIVYTDATEPKLIPIWDLQSNLNENVKSLRIIVPKSRLTKDIIDFNEQFANCSNIKSIDFNNILIGNENKKYKFSNAFKKCTLPKDENNISKTDFIIGASSSCNYLTCTYSGLDLTLFSDMFEGIPTSNLPDTTLVALPNSGNTALYYNLLEIWKQKNTLSDNDYIRELKSFNTTYDIYKKHKTVIKNYNPVSSTNYKELYDAYNYFNSFKEISITKLNDTQYNIYLEILLYQKQTSDYIKQTLDELILLVDNFIFDTDNLNTGKTNAENLINRIDNYKSSNGDDVLKDNKIRIDKLFNDIYDNIESSLINHAKGLYGSSDYQKNNYIALLSNKSNKINLKIELFNGTQLEYTKTYNAAINILTQYVSNLEINESSFNVELEALTRQDIFTHYLDESSSDKYIFDDKNIKQLWNKYHIGFPLRLNSSIKIDNAMASKNLVNKLAKLFKDQLNYDIPFSYSTYCTTFSYMKLNDNNKTWTDDNLKSEAYTDKNVLSIITNSTCNYYYPNNIDKFINLYSELNKLHTTYYYFNDNFVYLQIDKTRFENENKSNIEYVKLDDNGRVIQNNDSTYNAKYRNNVCEYGYNSLLLEQKKENKNIFCPFEDITTANGETYFYLKTAKSVINHLTHIDKETLSNFITKQSKLETSYYIYKLLNESDLETIGNIINKYYALKTQFPHNLQFKLINIENDTTYDYDYWNNSNELLSNYNDTNDTVQLTYVYQFYTKLCATYYTNIISSKISSNNNDKTYFKDYILDRNAYIYDESYITTDNRDLNADKAYLNETKTHLQNAIDLTSDVIDIIGKYDSIEIDIDSNLGRRVTLLNNGEEMYNSIYYTEENSRYCIYYTYLIESKERSEQLIKDYTAYISKIDAKLNKSTTQSSTIEVQTE